MQAKIRQLFRGLKKRFPKTYQLYRHLRKFLYMKKFRLILSFIKLLYLKIKNGKRLKILSFIQQLRADTEIHMAKDACLTLGSASCGTNVHIICGPGELSIGNQVEFNRNCIVDCRHKIIIGDNCMFGPNVCVFDNDHAYTADGISHSDFKCSDIIIEEGCWIGTGAIILRGTHIGKNSVIEAGSVIRGNIQANSIVTTAREYRIIPALKFIKNTQSAIQDVNIAADMASVTVESTDTSSNIIIDHNCIKLDQIPTQWIEKAIKDLHVAFGHTSHGSQIITGLEGLSKFKGSPYIYKTKREDDSIDLRDNPFTKVPLDLGNPDNKTWADETRKYLKKNKDINVVMWSWCGQLSKANDMYVDDYLNLMQKLENKFSNVTFVYMTGHLDGTGAIGNLAKNNDKIRAFCKKNNKVLFDFADIESYNPDGDYFLDKNANDKCDYDSDGNGKPDKNWASEWQGSHKEGVDWYQCASAHSQPVNANMKSYAAWWMMARLAGWDGAPAAQKGVNTYVGAL